MFPDTPLTSQMLRSEFMLIFPFIFLSTRVYTLQSDCSGHNVTYTHNMYLYVLKYIHNIYTLYIKAYSDIIYNIKNMIL